MNAAFLATAFSFFTGGVLTACLVFWRIRCREYDRGLRDGDRKATERLQAVRRKLLERI